MYKGTKIDTLSIEGDGDDVREKKAQRVLTKSNSRTDSHGKTLATNLQDENFSQYDIENMLMQMVTDKMKSVSLYLAVRYIATVFFMITVNQ